MQEQASEAGNGILMGSKLYHLRLTHNYTQQFVAEALGVAPSTLGRWEKDEDKINIGDLRKAAEFYEVGVEWLLSPDPLVLNIYDNKAENGANGAYNTVNVMPKEIWDRIDKRMDESTRLNEELLRLNQRLMNVLEKWADKDRI